MARGPNVTWRMRIELWPFDGFIVVVIGEPLACEFPDKEADYTQERDTTCEAETDDGTCAEPF